MIILGIDEAGRGCWAGPLVAGAVALETPIDGLNDSKKLSAIRRQELAQQISEMALGYGIGWVEAAELDQIGLTQAVGLAMQRAVEQIQTDYDEIIVDGNINYFPNDLRAKAVIRADGSVPAVSAASILAKEARDAYMKQQAHAEYPNHAFDRHVGYGTKLHVAMLEQYGITPLHRKSYKPIQALLQ